MTTQFIKLDNTAIIINRIIKMRLDESRRSVDVFVEGKKEPFSFTDEKPEQSISLFLHVSELIRQSTIVPFLFFSTVAVRLALVSAINLSGRKIILTLADQDPEIFAFASEKESQDAFDMLMKYQGLAEDQKINPALPVETSKAEVQISPKKSPVSKTKSKKKPTRRK